VHVDTDARVAQVRGLFAEAARNGRVPLGVLDDHEEAALGEGRWALSDAAAWLAWTALPDEERAAASGAALRRLTDRGLAAVEDAGETFRVTPAAPAALVVAARSSPTYVVTVLPDDEPPAVLPYGYGLVDEVEGDRGLVVELRGEGRHDYRLCSTAHAAEAFGTWAWQAVHEGVSGRRYGTVVLEVLRHREGEPLQAAAVTVPGPDAGKDGMVQLFGGERARRDAGDREALVEQVAALLRQAGS